MTAGDDHYTPTVPQFSLPEGMYLSISFTVRARFGGQTRALLMRNRFFTQYAGVDTNVLTFDCPPVYPAQREQLIERGDLIPGMRLLNIYEDYRDADLITGEPLGGPLPGYPGLKAVDVAHPDGTVYYTAYQDEYGTDMTRDYRRSDGSVYLRAPAPGIQPHPVPYTPADRQSRPLERWPKAIAWHHHWLRTLTATADRVLVISDSRNALADLVPMPDERFHVLHLMHNIHLIDRRKWNSAIRESYHDLLSGIGDLDGLVTLTGRQRADVEQRYGATNNLFVVSNPVALPERPDPLPERKPATFTIVSRWESQKRLDHAVRAFALAVAERPQAELLIYGRGSMRTVLARLITKLGLEDSVTLCGWDNNARDTLWTSTGFLMTSRFEGYPLASLESLSRGCPVVSYDIKYGPQEQVTDGVDGFLVPDGDQRAMADRIIQLIDNPDLVRSLSAAALDKASQHDYRAFLGAWQYALTKAVEQRPDRVELTAVKLTVHRLGYWPGPLPARLSSRLGQLRTGSAAFGGSRRLIFEADLRLRGEWPAGALRDAKITLDVISEESDVVCALPLRVRRNKRRFDLFSAFRLDDVFADRPSAERSVTMRLRLVLRNRSWETIVSRPVAAAPPFEIAYDSADRLQLHRATLD